MLSRRSSVIHSLIGIALMLVCACLPPVHPEITVLGMRVLGVFLGTLYLWITVGGVWEYISCLTAPVKIMGSRNIIYRASCVPYGYLPFVEKPEEIALPKIENFSYRVPGSLLFFS